MSKLSEIFDTTSPLLIITSDNEQEVATVIQTALSRIEEEVTIDLDLSKVSDELLHRSEKKSNQTNPIVVSTIIDEEFPGKLDFVHMDNIATQGAEHGISAIIGLITDKNVEDLIAQSSALEKFALDKAMVIDSNYASAYLS